MSRQFKKQCINNFRVLGIIPARGGSKSIIKKNIANLGDKPLIAHTIEAASASIHLDQFIVSTDSEEIASISRNLGANVPFIRPRHLATDMADSYGVVLHAMQFIEKQAQVRFDAVMLLQPTTPFRPLGLIDQAIEYLAKENFDSIVSVVNVGAIHPYRMYTLDENKELLSFCKNDINSMMPRQLLPPIFIRSGDIYVTRRNCLLDQKSLIGKHSGAIILDPKNTLNIDEPIDLEIARLMLKNNDAF